MGTIDIINDPERGAALLPDLLRATNTHTAELGFLSSGAYEGAIANGQLWFLTEDDAYGGHVFFSGALPVLKICQLFVADGFRERGLGHRLLDAVIEHAELQGYTSARARVASDLPANEFWQRMGFETLSTESGGRTTNRTINVRYRIIQPRGAQTNMFQAFADATSAQSARRPQVLVARGMPLNRDSWYTIDINVWFDFVRQRAPFFESACALVREANRGRFRLRFTSEALAEAQRTARGGTEDPLLAAAVQWQAVPEGDDQGLDELVEQLRALVFPNRAREGRRAANDTSDLRHLALSIRAGAAGFVTRERALLQARPEIWRRFQLDVLRPGDLLNPGENRETPATAHDVGVGVTPVERDWVRAARFAKSMMSTAGRLRELDREDKGWCCTVGDSVSGLTYWKAASRGDVEAFLAIDASEDIAEDLREQVFDVLMGLLVAEARSRSPFHRLFLRVDVVTSEHYRHHLQNMGFFPSVEGDRFIRFVTGDLLAFDSWEQAKQMVDTELGVQSTWRGGAETPLVLATDQGDAALTSFELETYFGVSALSLKQARAAVYVPIKEKFANQLLPRPRRPELFLERDASFRVERVYFRKPNGASVLAPGDIILFYVSDPIKAVIGAARCTVSEVLPESEASARFRRLAVIEPSDVVHCIAFDNYMPFSREVELSWLRASGGYPPQGMLTLVPLPPSLELNRILERGLGGDHD